MNYKKLYLAILIAAGVGILFAVLSALWVGFLCFFGVALFVGAVIFFIIQRQKYRELKDSIYQKRYTDAYIYADEHGQSLDVANFKYPRKQEAQLRNSLRDGFISYLSSILLCIFCGIVLVSVFINVF